MMEEDGDALACGGIQGGQKNCCEYQGTLLMNREEKIKGQKR